MSARSARQYEHVARCKGQRLLLSAFVAVHGSVLRDDRLTVVHEPLVTGGTRSYVVLTAEPGPEEAAAPDAVQPEEAAAYARHVAETAAAGRHPLTAGTFLAARRGREEHAAERGLQR